MIDSPRDGIKQVYRDIRSLPESEIAPFLHAAFVEALDQRYVDFDRFLVLGRKARTVRQDIVDEVLKEWLADEQTPAGVEIAANFLAAYWTHESKVPDALTGQALAQLDRYCERLGTSELLLLALDTVYPGVSKAMQQAIRERFREAAARLARSELQPFARDALDRVLSS
jgi:hypothetical protein